MRPYVNLGPLAYTHYTSALKADCSAKITPGRVFLCLKLQGSLEKVLC